MIALLDTHEHVKRLKSGDVDARFDIEACFREFEYRLIIKLGFMMVVAIGIVATLVKLL